MVIREALLDACCTSPSVGLTDRQMLLLLVHYYVFDFQFNWTIIGANPRRLG